MLSPTAVAATAPAAVKDQEEDPTTVPVPPTPSFSTLPLGPLTTAVLFLKEGDVAQLLRTSKDVNASALDSDEFWRERCCSTFGRHVGCIESLGKEAFRVFLGGKRHALDGSLTRRDDLVQRTRQLLHSCVGASSQDRDDELPAHTLVPSLCATLLGCGGERKTSDGKRFQVECGCVNAEKCYWSSEPSAVADRDEWLEYDLADSLAVVSSFMLTPYTSFWQPEQPTYNPVEACFQLVHPGVNQGKPYYESPRFRVDGSMTRQQFDLPQPTLSLGGTAKILLLGMAQRQTWGEEVGETANHYHICMSHAALQGAIIRSCRLAGAPNESPLPVAAAAAAPDTPAFKVGGGESRGVRNSAVGSSIQGLLCGTRGGTRAGRDKSGIRLRWVVTVSVRCFPRERPEWNGKLALDLMIKSAFSASRGVVLRKFDDTTCLEVIEEYARKQKVQNVGDVRLALMDDSGRVLPAGGVLGDFALQGRLDLVDASEDAAGGGSGVRGGGSSD